MLEAELKVFVEKIARQAQGGAHGYAGASSQFGFSAGIQGSGHSGAEVANSLVHSAVAFRDACVANDEKRLPNAAAALESDLLLAQTITLLSEKQASDLLDELHSFMEGNRANGS